LKLSFIVYELAGVLAQKEISGIKQGQAGQA